MISSFLLIPLFFHAREMTVDTCSDSILQVLEHLRYPSKALHRFHEIGRHKMDIIVVLEIFREKISRKN